MEDEHGPWTAHNVQLADGTYTIAPHPTGDEVKLRRILQIVTDLVGAPIPTLRVLDLASLEGMYTLELARRGAEVVAIEGREANLAKARLAGEVLGLNDRISWIHGDVRDLSPERHGEFDVVLCLGILYHLDAPDVFRFMEQMAAVCKSLLVIDTHVAPKPRVRRDYDGHTYWGHTLFEHAEHEPADVRLKRLWSSLDNTRAFVPTRVSLINLIASAGFSSAFECHLPPEPEKTRYRITLVARRGSRVRPELTLTPPWAELPEQPLEDGLLTGLARRLPRPVRRLGRTLARRPRPPRL